jgi:rare lipoprotein A
MVISLLLCLFRELLSGGAIASYYTNEESGSVTASGLPYLESEFTCAHRSIPFNTLVWFSANGREVMAIVTDRGPFVAGRTWDLSLACAKRLDMIQEGRTRVYAVPIRVIPDSSIQSTLEQLDHGRGVIYGYKRNT